MSGYKTKQQSQIKKEWKQQKQNKEHTRTTNESCGKTKKKIEPIRWNSEIQKCHTRKKLKKKWTEKQGKDTKKAFAIINFYRKLLSVLTQQKNTF